ncbi:MAG TPA: GNAT family N-acetyltransferase [Vicinamibacterales bacterium]|jgi:GNAT superfamily N-acetyltransferase|nr:GNAT family N-acetyltransferase [Vicinamibacterales bacterium]
MILRLLTQADLPDALRLSSTAGWNQQLEDWRMLLSLAPTGCFAALDADTIVGTSMGIPYGEFSWIAMMLVDPAYRGQGLGRRLLGAAMAAVPDDRPVRLDATPLGRPLYESFGFVEETRLTRFTATAAARRALTFDTPKATRPLGVSALERVAALDRRLFGADRSALLRWALNRSPQYARLTPAPADGGYCFGRQGRLFDQIGPIVAQSDHEAELLVISALAAAGERDVAIDAFDDGVAFTAWLRGCGFVGQRPLFRMRRPSGGAGQAMAARNLADNVAREYAIFGPEFA